MAKMDKKPNTAPPSTPLVLPSLKRKRPHKIEIPKVLQEIKSDTFKFQDLLTPQDDALSFSVIGVGVSAVKGKKKFMEDSHKIVSHGNSNKCFFGVYDGHGGTKAVEFVAENLHTNILEMMVNCTGNASKEEAVKAGYLKTDQEFLKQHGIWMYPSVLLCILAEIRELLNRIMAGLVSGACCVTALIEGQEVVVSNLGDCRAVLCRGGVAQALTKDHRAEREDERKRIENRGGYVEIHRGAWRVHGVLSVSRSIGDAHLKDWVPAEPDTKILQLTPDMEFLVLASDGLWEEVGNQEAIDIVIALCMAEKKLGPAANIQKYDDVDCGCVNVSPSSKLRRISLVKQQKRAIRSPSYQNTVDRWNDSKENFACETESPPSKSRRISSKKKINMQTESPVEENCVHKRRPASAALVTACKELMNLAVRRGSMDDITVMIIDLSHFRCNS